MRQWPALVYGEGRGWWGTGAVPSTDQFHGELLSFSPRVSQRKQPPSKHMELIGKKLESLESRKILLVKNAFVAPFVGGFSFYILMVGINCILCNQTSLLTSSTEARVRVSRKCVSFYCFIWQKINFLELLQVRILLILPQTLFRRQPLYIPELSETLKKYFLFIHQGSKIRGKRLKEV